MGFRAKVAQRAAYRQYVPVSRRCVKVALRSYGESPVDGIVELRCENAAPSDAAFGSLARRNTTLLALTLLSEVTAFAVANYRIV